MSEELTFEQKASFYRVKQQQSYDFKLRYAEIRAREFVSQCDQRGFNYHVNVGGLDSITLLMFLRSIGINCPAVSVSSLEDKSIQRVHKELGVESLKPTISKVQVLKTVGYPILSKSTAKAIEALQNPSPRNEQVRQAALTGITSTGHKYRFARKWLKLFGGSDPEGAKSGYKTAPFKVSDKCCYYMKEKPLDDYSKQHNSLPFVGLMASEGGRRERQLINNGCTYFYKDGKFGRSAPFGIFMRQDLLRLALDLNVPVPEIYGEIVRDPDGTLRTTGAQRTGCSYCGFGIQLQKRPHRFDLLYKENPKEWHFWMIDQGWGEVLDYIGVEWRIQEEMNLDGENE